MAHAVQSPARYDPSIEHVADDEAETIGHLNDTFRAIMETTSKDYGHAVRGVHAKGHGIARGTLTVAGGLPPELAQGMFARAGTYDAIIRISTTPGDLLDDSVSAPRGIGLKILGVEGERLPGSEGDTTQDFLMVNGPAFAAPTPKAFLANLKQLAATTDKVEGFKKALSATLQTIEAGLEAVGGKSALLSNLGGAPQVHPLGATYYTQTAFRYGDHIAKLSLVPVSRGLVEVTGTKINTHDRPDALRADVNSLLMEQGGVWELRVQLATDLDKMPVEDATKVWDEKLSPFVTVATLDVLPQSGWEYGLTEHTEDRLAFSPWHGLAAHRPLGGVNRARRATYDFSARFRAEFNRCPMHEPAAMDDLRVTPMAAN